MQEVFVSSKDILKFLNSLPLEGKQGMISIREECSPIAILNLFLQLAKTNGYDDNCECSYCERERENPCAYMISVEDNKFVLRDKRMTGNVINFEEKKQEKNQNKDQ